MNKISRLIANYHSWLYHHARWLYKFLSDYAYESNCEIEEMCDQLREWARELEEQAKINEIIKNRTYLKEILADG